MLLQLKTLEELNEETLLKLSEAGINSSPGSIARLFLHLINESIGEFYESLSVYHTNAFLSSAEGIYLDSIGYMLNCERTEGEDDESYRYRITKQTLSLATANETAIRLACLSVEGIEDVQLKAHHLGVGSFVVVVTSQSDKNVNALSDLEKRMKEVVGYGIRYQIMTPILRRVELSLKLLFKEELDDGVMQEIRSNVYEAIKTYILSRKLGESFIIQELTQQILNVDTRISNYVYQTFKINGESVLWVNQPCEWNERFTIGESELSLQVL